MPIEIASVEEQYKKFPKLDRAEVLKLKEWCNKQPHLPKITELEAIIFLHVCYYSVEQSKICMDTYYTIRSHFPEIFGRRDVFGADIAAQMNITALMPLRETTKEGYHVTLGKLTEFDASKYNFVDNFKLYFMAADLWLASEGIAEGYAVVLDMEGISLSHLTKFNVSVMKKFMYYIQEGSPVRLKALHFINTVSFMDKVLALMRPFIKNELMDIIHFHSSLDTFVDIHVLKSAMPDEYGGSGGKIKDIQDKTNKELQDNAQFFVDEETTKRVNEKLRPGKPKTANDLFGIDGNFKQLSFD